MQQQELEQEVLCTDSLLHASMHAPRCRPRWWPGSRLQGSASTRGLRQAPMRVREWLSVVHVHVHAHARTHTHTHTHTRVHACMHAR